MGYILKKIGNEPNIPYQYFECDSITDMNLLDTSKIPMGSIAFIINDGTAYTLNSLKEWKERPIGGSGGDLNFSDITLIKGGDSFGNS